MKWVLGVGGGFVLGIMIVHVCFGPNIAKNTYALFMIPIFGWVVFLWRVARQIRFDIASIVTFVTCLVVLAIGFHQTAKWFCSHNRSVKTPWHWRWSLYLLALVVLAFTAGVAVIGIVHQTGWMLTSPVNWFYS